MEHAVAKYCSPPERDRGGPEWVDSVASVLITMSIVSLESAIGTTISPVKRGQLQTLL